MTRVLMTLAMLAVAVVAGAAPDTRKPMSLPDSLGVHVRLVVESDLSPRALRVMKSEGERIWSDYGVALRWSEMAPAAPISGISLTLRVADVTLAESGRPDGVSFAAGGVQTGGSGALAWVWFVGGAPRDEIQVSVSAARRLVGATRVAGRAVSAWPPAMRSDLMGRALGRSVAHELGHYLMRSKTHTDTGLMRASFTPADLVSSRHQRFRLPADAVRLLATYWRQVPPVPVG